MKPRSEDDLNKEQIYPDPETIQEMIIENGPYPGALRRWLFGRKVQPIVLAGALANGQRWRNDWITGLYIMFEQFDVTFPAFWTKFQQFFSRGNSTDAYTISTDTSVNVASQAAFVLTVPANHAYKIILASIRNGNRGPTVTYLFTPDGGTASIFTFITAGVAGQTFPLIGGSTGYFGATGVNGPKELWMQAGDTLELNNNNFVAADVMRHDFIFEDYIVS